MNMDNMDNMDAYAGTDSSTCVRFCNVCFIFSQKYCPVVDPIHEARRASKGLTTTRTDIINSASHIKNSVIVRDIEVEMGGWDNMCTK